jgi:hypothetical protein
MNIISDSTPNKTVGRAGKAVDTIVLHSTYGSYSGSVAWLKNPTAKVSAHYIISENGEIRRLVEEKDTAWANGNLDSNQRSITIETTDNKQKDITQKAKEALIWLVADIKKRHTIKDIKFHREIVATACPYLNIDKAWFTNSSNDMTDLQACLTAHKQAMDAIVVKDKEIAQKNQMIENLNGELSTCSNLSRSKDTFIEKQKETIEGLEQEVSTKEQELIKATILIESLSQRPTMKVLEKAVTTALQEKQKEYDEIKKVEDEKEKQRIDREYVKKSSVPIIRGIQEFLSIMDQLKIGKDGS